MYRVVIFIWYLPYFEYIWLFSDTFFRKKENLLFNSDWGCSPRHPWAQLAQRFLSFPPPFHKLSLHSSTGFLYSSLNGRAFGAWSWALFGPAHIPCSSWSVANVLKSWFAMTQEGRRLAHGCVLAKISLCCFQGLWCLGKASQFQPVQAVGEIGGRVERRPGEGALAQECELAQGGGGTSLWHLGHILTPISSSVNLTRASQSFVSNFTGTA